MTKSAGLSALLCALSMAVCLEAGELRTSPPAQMNGPPDPQFADGFEDPPPPPNASVDLLFVIDNSNDMAEEQASLTNAFESFADELAIANGGVLPSLHIGIISTDLGAGGHNVPGCAGAGDEGILQNTPSGQCQGPADRYIVDVEISPGVRETNYSGTLADTFSCIAPLGINGCGFEQPLQSMRRALDGSNPENQGFIRDDAALAIIIMTTEDDCSAFNPDLFDATLQDILGPLSSFRCFEYGVVCDPDQPRIPGVKSDCASREESLYTFPVQGYTDLLQMLKSPDRLVVATVQGPASPVSVSLNVGGDPDLDPSCAAASETADPGVRLSEFVGQFANAHEASVCSNIPAALDQVAVLIGSVLASQ